MNNIKHRPLKEEFTKNGFVYKLVIRRNDKAIFEQTKKGRVFAYEVVIISRHDGYTLGGVRIEPAETYPSGSEWGVKGFTCTTLERAQERFKLM